MVRLGVGLKHLVFGFEPRFGALLQSSLDIVPIFDVIPFRPL